MVEIAVRSKDKFYRGKNVEELRDLDVREFSKLVKARSRRTILRNFDVIEQFIKKCKIRTAKKKMIKTHNRSLVIVPAFVGLTIHVHNGKDFVPVNVVSEMLGHRFGEFALTRKPVKHGAAGVGATKSSASLSVK